MSEANHFWYRAWDEGGCPGFRCLTCHAWVYRADVVENGLRVAESAVGGDRCRDAFRAFVASAEPEYP